MSKALSVQKKIGYGRTDTHTDRSFYSLNGWMDGWINGWMDGWMDEFTALDL